MHNRIVLTPPTIEHIEGKTIFLAGPIQGAPDWHSDASDFIHGIDDSIVIRSPRKDYEPGTFVYNDQVDWETANLREAGRHGVILFWLAKQVESVKKSGEQFERAYAQTSRYELAEWAKERMHSPVRLAIGIEEGFGNERYIRRRFSQDNPDVPIASTLAQTCMNAIDLLNNGD